MKKQLLFLGALFTLGTTAAQNTFPTGAGTNVGIGTTSPSTRLQVTSASAGTSGIRMTNLTSSSGTSAANGKALNVDSSGNIILVPMANTDTSIYLNDGTLAANRIISLNTKNLTFTPSASNSQFFINGTSGKVGMGTLTPTTRLDVSGDLKANQTILSITPPAGTTYADFEAQFKDQYIINGGPLVAGNTFRRTFTVVDNSASSLYTKANFNMGIEDRNDMNRFRLAAETGGTTTFRISNKTQQALFNFYEDGSDNVTLTMPKANSFLGIGTSSFTDGSDTYRLAVKGAIRADRVKVYTTWADFVFEKNYDLPTLSEVEKHIQENGHLKDIPSAKEVEANGIELGEMNKRLLQKVEELTLYMIQLNKELETVKAKLNQQ